MGAAAIPLAIIGGGLSAASILNPPRIPSAPSPPRADDPAVAASARRQREAELRRKGRSSTIVTGGAGVIEDAPLSQPAALGA
jgi:hypothetical protein